MKKIDKLKAKYIWLTSNTSIGERKVKNYRRRIHGEYNEIDLGDNKFENLNIFIKGNNNKIRFMSNTNVCKDLSISMFGDNQTVFIGKNVELFKTKIDLVNCESVLIKENAVVKSSWLCNHGRKIVIGQNSSMGGSNLQCLSFSPTPKPDIIIGDNCAISFDSKFRTADGHPIYSKKGKLLNPDKSINLSERVWICEGVQIMKGVNLPKECIIGGFSKVFKSFSKENSLYGGNPAKFIKKLEGKWQGGYE